jgi:hypothetical protein
MPGKLIAEMTRQRFLAAALAAIAAPLLLVRDVFAALVPGQFEVGWIYENTMHRKPSTAQFAVFHGDACNFHVSYDKDRHCLVVISEANAEHAATDGFIPEMSCRFGGCSNQVWIDAREVN